MFVTLESSVKKRKEKKNPRKVPLRGRTEKKTTTKNKNRQTDRKVTDRVA